MRFAALLARCAASHVLWQTLRLLSACCLAYGSAVALGLPNGFWAMITAVVVTQPAFGATLAASRDRILGTVIGALAGLLLVEGVRHGLPLLPLFWAAMVPLALLTAMWPNLRMACITLIVVLLVPAGDVSFGRPIDRVVEILLGTIASLVVAATFHPRRR